ncbi:hypothetical protein [Kitasatospora sp. NBC_01266]|uniref:hypothetical protein n=1 Tax=Kitasatospora sp. NBC_01266 TaxID=2903572 RepID=UPI002E3233F1|nr:hypothetical protein [Kitasatospora sp. NBC_01266]
MTHHRIPGPVLVELTGITPLARFARLADALAAAWESMRLLPLSNAYYCAFELMLVRPSSVDCMAERLAKEGTVAITFMLPDGPHLFHLRPAREEVTAG